jgi:octaprenyl-diphosphate synthase
MLGIDIGMAFQIKDDLFDYQPHGITGKPAANDLKEKKFTLPLIYALEQSRKNDSRSILRLIRNGNMNKNKIDYIIDFVKSHKGLEFAEKKMYEFKSRAEGILYEFDDNEARRSLLELISFTVERNK